MKWKSISILVRIVSLLISISSFTVAWYLTKIGSSGIEDVPPPFILVAGAVGIGFLFITLIGRFPFPYSDKSNNNQE